MTLLYINGIPSLKINLPYIVGIINVFSAIGNILVIWVASDEYAIGYVSLGSLDDTVKAVSIDGAEATVENIKNGTYTIARPFNIATKGEASDITQDFINYIMLSLIHI